MSNQTANIVRCPEDRSRRFVPVGTLRRHKLHIARFRVKHESSFISLLLLFPQKPSLLWEPCDAVMAATSPEDISRSDGHAIFKVQVRLQDHFSEKYSPLPYIQEVGNAPKTQISTLMDRNETGQEFEGRTPLCSQNSPFRNGSKTCAWSAA